MLTTRDVLSSKGLFYILSGCILLCSFILRFTLYSDFFYDSYIDRDLIRASLFPDIFFVNGPELSIAGRIPGAGFYYYLWLIKTLLFGQINMIHLYLAATQVMAIFIVYKSIRKYKDQLYAILTTLLYSSVSIYIELSQTFWNPTFGIVFNALAYYCLIKTYFKKSVKFFIIGIVLSCISAQMHLSGILYLIAFIIIGILQFRALKLKGLVYGILTILIMYSPFLIFNKSDQSIINTIAIKDTDAQYGIENLTNASAMLSGVIYLDESGFREGPQWALRKNIKNRVEVNSIFLLTLLLPTFSFIAFILLFKKLTKHHFLLFNISFLLLLWSFFATNLLYHGDYAINIRKFVVTAIPLLTTIVGLGLSLHKRTTTVLVILTCFVNLYYCVTTFKASNYTYSFFTEMIQIHSEKLGLNIDYIKKHTSLIHFDLYENNIVHVFKGSEGYTVDHTGIDYFQGKEGQSYSDANTCTVVLKKDEHISKENISKLLQTFKISPLKIYEGKRLFVATFQNLQASCPKNYISPYTGKYKNF